MASEGALWRALRKRLSDPPKGELTRCECAIPLGLPDVHYALVHHSTHGQGWIELKQVAAAPVRPRTPVRYEYQFGQQAFLARHWALGGHAYVLAQVGRTYILHTGAAAQAGAGVEWPMARLLDTAVMHWQQPWTDEDTEELLLVLTGPRQPDPDWDARSSNHVTSHSNMPLGPR